MADNEMNTIKIDGKTYDQAKLSESVKKWIVARQEIMNNRTRIEMEMEKIEVLCAFYNKKILDGVKDIKPIETK